VPDLAEGVTKLESEVEAIDVQSTHHFDEQFRLLSGGIHKVDAKVTALDTKVTALDRKVTRLDRRLTGVERRLNAVERTVTAIDGRLDGIDRRLDEVDRRLDGVTVAWAASTVAWTGSPSTSRSCCGERRRSGRGRPPGARSGERPKQAWLVFEDSKSCLASGADRATRSCTLPVLGMRLSHPLLH
jgi:outer membrane murein-binding lipoprotein Lpp